MLRTPLIYNTIACMPAYFTSPLGAFSQMDPQTVLGALARGVQTDGFTYHINKQTEAWATEISLLQSLAMSLATQLPASTHWGMLLEYPIPRRQKRIDAVLLADDLILVIECKIGAVAYSSADRAQVEDYALDLRDFHAESRDRVIIPILLCTHARSIPTPPIGNDIVQQVHLCNPDNISNMILNIHAYQHQSAALPIDCYTWDNAAYNPVPTILEAAEALYARQDVREITSSHADACNLAETSERLIDIIETARAERKKVVCFVTGVPGAGKTLAGLNAIHNPLFRLRGEAPGAFLSGNGPLVRIVSEALARDHAAREPITRAEARRQVTAFIQNVHVYIDTYYKNEYEAPVDHAVVFDEAQRAWDFEHGNKKFNRPASEAVMVLTIMDRHPDWAVVICLVGSGQEIHSGEAGLGEWGRALSTHFPHWQVYAPPTALHEDSNVLYTLFPDGKSGNLTISTESKLHLPVSIRSYKARQVANWVNAVIEGNSAEAASIVQQTDNFHILMTRDLVVMRQWLRENTRGTRRCGLVASSGAYRLRAYGFELDPSFHRQYPKENWFLDGRDDVRSSHQLEVVAREFDCQGLELDDVGLCWCNDYIRKDNDWQYRKFIGTRWSSIRSEIERTYLANKYRVLMTRAREGMIIWVPPGIADDPTIPPHDFDETAAYLKACGLKEINS